MIIVKLQGGLGNQMFQYAFGRAVSKRLSVQLALETHFFRYTQNRTFALNQFNIEAKILNSSSLSIANLKNKIRTVREKTPGFDPTVLDAPDGSTFDGYWQSEKYFEPIKELIRKELTLMTPLSTIAQEAMNRVRASASVSIHVRRGDYASVEKIRNVHGLLDANYYQEALAKITKKESSLRLFVFSDDIPWVKANLPFPSSTEYVSELGLSESEELSVMSACKHHIIANSSFSWWGAWLNPNPNKIVIAPKQWFADAVKNSNDIVPKSWIRI